MSLGKEFIMKTVILVRHGKAKLAHPELDDIDRPLRHRGKVDSDRMARELADLDVSVDALISSPALRARSTASLFADQLFLPVETDERIYNGMDSDLLDVIQEMNEDFSTVLLVGHNPSISDLLRDLLDDDMEDLPTASVAVLEMNVKDWQEIHSGSASLEYLLTPDALDQSHAA